jgi:competence protein ComEA
MNYLSRSQAAALIFLALLLLSLYGWDHDSHNQQPAKSPQLAPKYVFVQVSGKVRSPGIYSFDQAVTVGQALARAGGPLSPLRQRDELTWAKGQTGNGSRIQIITEPSGVTVLKLGWMAVPIRLALGVPLDINQASVADLTQVPGINAKLADRIVALRVRSGGYSRLENLYEVKGIGPATVRRLHPYLTVGPAGD